MSKQELKNKPLRVMFADDEAPAREKLAHQLSLLDDIEVIAIAKTGREAISLIEELKPDVALLDIQMPEINGIDLLSLLSHKPFVIFTTAYDNYAVEAFRLNSLDYLLKPYPLIHLKQAIDKAKHALTQSHQAKEAVIKLSSRFGEKRQRLISKQGDRIFIINPNEIYFIKSEQSTALAWDGEKYHVLSETLDTLSEELEGCDFIRVHRSYLINIDKISEIQRWFNGKLMLIMSDNNKTEISTSRPGAEKIKSSLGF